MEKPSDKSPKPNHLFFILLATLFLNGLVMAFIPKENQKMGLLALEATFILPMLIYVIYWGYDFRTIFKWYTVPAPLLIVASFIGFGMTFMTDGMDWFIQSYFPMNPDVLEDMQELMTINSAQEGFVLILSVVFLAAFGEEMLFRGLIQSTLEKHVNITKAVMMTALIFTIVHFNPWWSVEILILGVVLGVLTWRSGSLFPAILVHLITNSMALFMMNTDKEYYAWYFTGDHISPTMIVIGLILTIGGFKKFYQMTAQPGTD